MATRQIPWARISAEGVAIVISILLAFGIQAWWEGRQERQLRRITLEGLLADFEAAAPDVAVASNAHQMMLAGTQAFVEALNAGEGASAVMVADTLLIAALLTPTYDPPRASVELALGTGRLGEVEDEPLRRLLAQWLQELDDTREEEDMAMQLVAAHVVPLLASVPGIDEVLEGIGNTGTPGGPRMPERVSSRSVPRSEILIGLLAIRMTYTRRAISGMTGLVALQQTLVDSLQALVARR